MSIKLKAFGFSLLALLALGAFAAINASAERDPNGHFTHDGATVSAFVTGHEKFCEPLCGEHFSEMAVPGLTGMVCTETTYKGTINATTVQEVSVTPEYKGCKTTGSVENSVTVDVNGCSYNFTITKNSEGDNTVDLVCPVKPLVITHEGCEITVPAQTVGGVAGNGVAYTTSLENGKHTITLDSTFTFSIQFHSGFCLLLGTSKTAELKGSATVEGLEDINGVEGAQVNITATGSEK